MLCSLELMDIPDATASGIGSLLLESFAEFGIQSTMLLNLYLVYEKAQRGCVSLETCDIMEETVRWATGTR